MAIFKRFNMAGLSGCRWCEKWNLDYGKVRRWLDQRIARILFTVKGEKMILLHGFIKKSQKTPQADMQLAKDRKANLEK